MSKHSEYHTIEISIPKEMLNLSKAGRVSLVPSITKTGNISKRSGNASIILKKSDDNKPHILDQGIVLTKEQMQSWAKPKTVKSKVIKHNAKPKLLHEEVEKRPESNERHELKVDTKYINPNKKDSIQKRYFNEWVGFIKPLQNSSEWQNLTEQLKYYYYRVYKSHFENVNPTWFEHAFGLDAKIPHFKLTKEVQDYMHSKPKLPPKWRYEDSMSKYNEQTGWKNIHGQITRMLVAEHVPQKLEYMFK